MPAPFRFTAPAALLLGVALGLLAGWGEPAATAGVPAPEKESVSPSSRRLPESPSTLTSRSRSLPPTGGSAAAYAAAWESLKDGKLPRQERTALQRALLEEWALVDLPAAIHAAATDDVHDVEDEFGQSTIDSLQKGIAAQLDLAWDIIQTGGFGLRTPRLRSAWIQALAGQDPVGLIGKLPQLPQGDRSQAMRAAVVGSHQRGQSANSGEQVVAALLALRGTENDQDARAALAVGLSASVRCRDLRADFLRQQDPDVRPIYLEAYALSFRQLNAAERDAEMDALPADLRAEVEQARESPRER